MNAFAHARSGCETNSPHRPDKCTVSVVGYVIFALSHIEPNQTVGNLESLSICKLWAVVETVVILSGALKLNDIELGMPFD